MHDDEVLKISNGNELPVLIRWIPIYVDSVVKLIQKIINVH